MSMSMHVIGLRDLDGTFQKMLEAKRFCDERQLSYPQEVEEYFGEDAGEYEAYLRDKFARVDLDSLLTEWREEMREGYELDIRRLPDDVKAVRFYCSW